MKPVELTQERCNVLALIDVECQMSSTPVEHPLSCTTHCETNTHNTTYLVETVELPMTVQCTVQSEHQRPMLPVVLTSHLDHQHRVTLLVHVSSTAGKMMAVFAMISM